MSSIHDLAREFGAQPYEVEAFYGERIDDWDADLPAEVETVIREAWDPEA